jgi:hypothetical protein
MTCAVLAAACTALSLVGSSVAEAYQVPLKAAVVPDEDLRCAPGRASCAFHARAAGVFGLLTTVIGLAAAFLPTSDVTSVTVFETKMVIGVAGPIGIG